MTEGSILLAGAGGHARSCIDVIEQEHRYAIAGLIGSPEEVGSSVLGYAVVGTDADLDSLRDRATRAMVVVGQIKSSATRQRLFDQLLGRGFIMATAVSPRAYVSRHASIGAGTIVMHGAVVNAGAHVGRNCIVNSNALIEHDAMVGDHCHIATSATVNGAARVHDGVFVGSGSVLREGIAIGRGCVIGMGQTVLADCADGTTVSGHASP